MNKKRIIVIFAVVLVIAIVGIVYVRYNNIKKDIIFKLVGDEYNEVYLNSDFKDLGVIAKYKDEDLKDYYLVTNKIDKTKEGEYKIIYSLNYKMVKKTISRTVKVIRDPVEDISINLVGDSIVYILKNNEYQELGITAIDYVDGSIANSVTIEGTVDTNNVMEYKINYTVKNSRNASKTITRKVIVYDYDYEMRFTEDGEYLKLDFIASSDYVESILINNETIKGYKISYVVNNNQDINVVINDIYGNKKLAYYDFIKPSLSCNAVIDMNGVNITSLATDNKQVVKYRYCFDGNCYDSDNASYQYKQMTKNISVEVYDSSNNSKKSSCNIIDNVPFFDSGLKSNKYSNWGYYLYVPSNVRRYEQYPLIVFLHGSGERGTNMKLLESYGLVKFIKKGSNYNTFILTPQLSSGGTWRSSAAKVIDLIEEIKKNYNINPKKISISGFSLGGGDLANIVESYQNYFSSAVMIAPGYRGSTYAKFFKDIPTKVFNGSNDSYSNTSTTKAFVNELSRIGGNVTYTTFPSLGHNVVDKVFSDNSLIEWMISQTKK